MEGLLLGKELTDRQREVLDAIRRYIAEKGFPPSIRELGQMVGIQSLRGVTIHLDALQRKGWIERERTSRGIRLSRRAEAVAVPILEPVKAGADFFTTQNVEDYLFVPADMTNTGDKLFAIRVSGDNLIGDHVIDGDYVIVRRSDTANKGSIVALQIDNAAVVKRIDMDAKGPTLLSHNRDEQQDTLRGDNERVLGTVVALFRRI